jgi:DNA-binding MarR family transcriptional regulator
MAQRVDLERSVGLALKQAASALQGGMASALRPLDLTVTQYACLEQLGHRPEQSSAELARAIFVTRQSMGDVLLGLRDRGLLARDDTADRGRARAVRLTAEGETLRIRASTAVRGVEERMLAGLDGGERDRLREALASCVAALAGASAS